MTDVVNDAPGLVRMHNALGGIDEYGEVISPPSLQANTSGNLTYSVANGVSGITSVTTVPTTSALPPNTNGSSFKALGSSYDIRLPQVGDASYYQVFEAHTQNVSLPSDSSYQLVYSGSTTVAQRTIYTTRYRWYRYKACNSAGCSGLSPYRRVYVYDSAGVPNNFAVSLSPAAVNTNYTLSWTPANGAIDGTVYRLYEINGLTESLVYSVTRNHWSERLYDYDTSKSTGGDYQYRVEACSPSVACGYSATLSQTILAPNAAPIVSPSTPTHNSVYTADTDQSKITIAMVRKGRRRGYAEMSDHPVHARTMVDKQ